MTAIQEQTKLLKLSQLSADQENAIQRLYEHNATFLIAKMGAGKTVVAMIAGMELIAECHLERVLVVAPKRVCLSVWAHEYKKWEGCEHMSVAVASGTEAQRKKAIESDSDFLVINYELVAWLFETYGNDHGCDGLILDELTRIKSAGSKVFKRLRSRVHRFKWRVGMTGTPVSENYESLFSQVLALDCGEALGKRKDVFLDTYFYPIDFERRNWKLREGADEAIVERIKSLVYTMPDYRHELPPIEYHEINVDLPNHARLMYKKLKNDFLLQLEQGLVVAQNAAVLTGKLSQIANGFLYNTETEDSFYLHDEKLKALQEIVTLSRENCLIAYWYQHDLALLKKLTGYPSLADANTPKKLDELVSAWNSGEIKGLLIHPRSAGHGLNLAQGGCNIIWYSPQWSRDLWEQLNARLWRTGQTKTVNVYTIIADKTIDRVIVDRVEGKGKFDAMLLKHLKA